MAFTNGGATWSEEQDTLPIANPQSANFVSTGVDEYGISTTGGSAAGLVSDGAGGYVITPGAATAGTILVLAGNATIY